VAILRRTKLEKVQAEFFLLSFILVIDRSFLEERFLSSFIAIIIQIYSLPGTLIARYLSEANNLCVVIRHFQPIA
jgi:hypothetical protein